MASEAAKRRAHRRNWTSKGRVKRVPKRVSAPTSVTVRGPQGGTRTYTAPRQIARVVAATPARSPLPAVGPSAWTAATALSPSQQREADLLGERLARYLNRKAGREGTFGGGTGKRVASFAEAASLAVPGLGAAGLVGRAGKLGVEGLRAAKVARNAERVSAAASRAERANRVSRTARGVAKAAKRAGADAKQLGKIERRVDRAERAAARARVRASRAKLSRGERVLDRARSAKTRVQAQAYSKTHMALVGGGGAGGAGALAAVKSSPTKRAAAKAFAREGAKRAVTAPRRIGGQTVRAGATPALLPVTGVVPSEQKVQNLAQLPVQLGRATIENPGGVLSQSLKSGQDMLPGALKAVEQIVTNPKGSVKMMAEDYSRRYGPLIEGDMAEFRRRVKEEGGVTPFALDALIAAPPAGRVAGAAARSGALGKRAQRFMTEDRPGLIVQGGAKAKRQRLSRNMAGVAVQRVSDRARGRVTKRRGGRHGAEPIAQRALGEGKVVPVFHRSKIVRDAAGSKARGRLRLLAEGGRVAAEVQSQLWKMNRGQRTALKYALGFGLKTPGQARVFLRKHIEDIRANRDPNTSYGTRLDNIPDIERVIAKADEIFTPEYRQQLDQFRRTEKRIASQDPGLNPEQALLRREAQQAELLVGKRSPDESVVAYRKRYRNAMREQDLSEPGYFPSELSRRRGFSQSAIGGMRHAEQVKRYTGKLHREGIENLDPAVLIRSMQQGVKRKHQWPMVSGMFERNSLPWSRKPDGHGITRSEAVRHIEENGIDPDSVRLVNPGLVRQQFDQMMEPGSATKTGGLVDPDDFQFGAAIRSVRDAMDGTGEFSQQRGWMVVPKALIDELESSAKVGKVGRTLDMLMSKSSGYLLAYNTGWLGFQTLSTAMQAAMRGVTPADWLLAQIFWHKNKPKMTGERTVTGRRTAASSREVLGSEDFDRLNAYTGISMGHDFRDVPHLGAAVPDNMIGGAVGAFRAFREGRWGAALHKVNPIQAWFRLSQLPENANRRALAYKVLKSDEIKRMNGNVKAIDRAMGQITAHFQLDPTGQLKAAIRNRPALENMAKELEAFLGDYQRFTAAERNMLKRWIPFYSWMRFATKFALFTLPSRHPMATGLAYQLGRLQTEDLRDLLGDGMGWALGKLFLGKIDKDSPFIDMYRGNPLLSALTEFHDVKDLTGFIPPYMGVVLDSVAGKSIFSGKGLTVDGETVERKFTSRGAANEAQILVNNWLSMFTPYRVAQEIEQKGRPVSDDSLLFRPEYKRYAAGSGSDSWQRGVRDYQELGGAAGVLKRRMLPFLPQDPRTLHSQAEYMNAERQKELDRIEENKRRKPGSGGSSGGLWSSGSSSGSLWSQSSGGSLWGK